MPYHFVQIDAFSHRPLFGNPAAVVFDADDLTGEVMQRIAGEMNLSETVFLLKPVAVGADYRVRIFTPRSEIPFAGHPTVAAAFAVRQRCAVLRQKPLLVQECGAGLIPVEVIADDDGDLLRMTQPVAQYADCAVGADRLAAMLGCRADTLSTTPAQVVSTGVPWLIVQVESLAVMSSLVPDQTLIASECRALKAAGITVFTRLPEGSARMIRLRTFAPGEGVPEDPVCGSGNGAVAAYIARHVDQSPTGAYSAEQGIEIGRDGIVHASWSREKDRVTVRIAGAAAMSARGELILG